MILHPAAVHLPIALIFFSPVLTLTVWYICRRQGYSKNLHLFNFIWNLLCISVLYATLSLGERDALNQRERLESQKVENHRSLAGYLFNGSLAVLLASVVNVKKQKTEILQASLFLLQIGMVFLSIWTAKLGHCMVLPISGFFCG